MFFKHSVSVLLLLFVSANCNEDPFAFLLDFEGLATKVSSTNCTKPGLMCDGCTEVYYCIQMPNSNEWIQTSVGSCGVGETCILETGYCSKEENPRCDTSVSVYNGICNQIGFFPDPFQCNKYYLCSPKTPKVIDTTDAPPASTDSSSVSSTATTAANLPTIVPPATTTAATPPEDDSKFIRTGFKCLDGFGYDPLTTTCSIVLGSAGCKAMVVPPCKSMGLFGMESNPFMFYICMPSVVDGQRYFFPQFYYCSGNYKFVGNTCVDPAKQLNVVNEKCTAIGTFASPECNKFHNCVSVGTAPVNRSCAFGYKFNAKTKACIPMTCTL